MPRRLTPELMDDPAVPTEALQHSLMFLRFVNRAWGGQAALIGHLRRWSRHWPTDRPITLLDIATGSADLPIAVVRWAERTGRTVRVVAIDAHDKTLAEAREQVSKAGLNQWIEVHQADALRLTDLYQPGQFDYVHAGLFLHHLPDIEVLTMLRIMERLAGKGIIWNDLIRSGWNRFIVAAATIGQPRIIKHDARVSVEAAFTKAEALDIRNRLGLQWCTYHANPLMGRFTLAGEKTGAWANA